MHLDHIKINLEKVHRLITSAERRYHRSPGSVKLLAVSKEQSAAAIKAAFEQGQLHFGENYLQEVLVKMYDLREFNIDWHFIGHIQANKTKVIAQNFNWVQSVDRVKIAERLNEHRTLFMSPLNVLIEVNLDEEVGKSGVSLTHLDKLVSVIQKLPRLKLRGLMAIPEYKNNFDEQRKSFKRLREAFDNLCSRGLNLDILSMGMSRDFEAAIAEGSTLVRIGTAIFGAREA